MAWEDCEGNIRRQEVPGGWIYKIPEPYLSAVFVPEPSKVTGSNHDAELDATYESGRETGYKAAKDEVTPSLKREVMELLRSASEHLDDLEVRYAQTKVVRAMNKLEGI